MKPVYKRFDDILFNDRIQVVPTVDKFGRFFMPTGTVVKNGVRELSFCRLYRTRVPNTENFTLAMSAATYHLAEDSSFQRDDEGHDSLLIYSMDGSWVEDEQRYKYEFTYGNPNIEDVVISEVSFIASADHGMTWFNDNDAYKSGEKIVFYNEEKLTDVKVVYWGSESESVEVRFAYAKVLSAHSQYDSASGTYTYSIGVRINSKEDAEPGEMSFYVDDGEGNSSVVNADDATIEPSGERNEFIATFSVEQKFKFVSCRYLGGGSELVEITE